MYKEANKSPSHNTSLVKTQLHAFACRKPSSACTKLYKERI